MLREPDLTAQFNWVPQSTGRSVRKTSDDWLMGAVELTKPIFKTKLIS